MSHPNQIGGEPKDGDFVAYLEEIERRQARAIALSAAGAPGEVGAHAPKGPPSVRAEPEPLNKDQARALVEALKAQARSGGVNPNQFVAALVLAFIGLVFLLVGLGTDGGIFAVIISAVLFWQAWRRLRALFGGAAGDLATRLQRQQKKA